VKPQFLTGYEQGVLIFFSQAESVTTVPRENLTGQNRRVADRNFERKQKECRNFHNLLIGIDSY